MFFAYEHFCTLGRVQNIFVIPAHIRELINLVTISLKTSFFVNQHIEDKEWEHLNLYSEELSQLPSCVTTELSSFLILSSLASSLQKWLALICHEIFKSTHYTVYCLMMKEIATLTRVRVRVSPAETVTCPSIYGMA